MDKFKMEKVMYEHIHVGTLTKHIMIERAYVNHWKALLESNEVYNTPAPSAVYPFVTNIGLFMLRFRFCLKFFFMKDEHLLNEKDKSLEERR